MDDRRLISNPLKRKKSVMNYAIPEPDLEAAARASSPMKSPQIVAKRKISEV
jgi:hypothetical protein